MQSVSCFQLLSERILSLLAERDRILAAADILATAQRFDRLIHLFGTEPALAGLTSEVFFRPGSLTNMNPILDPVLDPAHGSYRSALCMFLDGLGPCVLDYYEYIEPGDPILLLGSDPSLPLFKQSLGWAKRHELSTIAVLSESNNCDADVVLITGCNDFSMHALLTGALLNAIMEEAAALLPEDAQWTGSYFVDAERERAKIDTKLERIKHL